MKYIESTLINDEKIIFWTKLHWIYFFFPLFITLSFTFFYLVTERKGLFGLFLIVILIYDISTLISYTTSEFGVTNKRLITKVGFIRRETTEIFINKIEAIKVNQGILGRILNFGTLTIIGSGGTKNSFSEIIDPLYFKNQVEEQLSLLTTVNKY